MRRESSSRADDGRPADSSTDNLRPLIPVWPGAQGRTLVVWMRGVYRVNRGEWNTAVVTTLFPPTR